MIESRSLFVTGTDTGVGKTLIAAATVRALVDAGYRTVGMKPLASGSRHTRAGLRNDDASMLMSCANVQVPYSLVNPYCFEPAIAPHIAATEAGVQIELAKLRQAHEALMRTAEIVVIEGAGGWLTPLGEGKTLADFAKVVAAEVILVVGLRLGCISHALLTAQSIAASGLMLRGWVANTIDPQMPRLHENVQALKERLAAPLMAVVPHCRNPASLDAAELLSASFVDALSSGRTLS